MQIVDAHHHIWRQADLPWLTGPMQPRIFGPYASIRRDYPISEFIADATPHGVTRSVYVQANWPKGEEEAEIAYVQREADESGWPHAIVGYANLEIPDIRPVLDRLKRYPLLRGIRMQLHWHANDHYRFAARHDLADDPVFRRNFARLAAYGLSFELQVFAPQMESAAHLAADNPEVTLVLQHCGMPEDLSHDGMEAWRTGMKTLAAEPNVVVKLSGLGTFLHENDPAHIAHIAAETIGFFGTGRCLFGSNFPIEKIWTGYGPLIRAWRHALAVYTPEEQAAMLAGNAARVYRL